MLENEWDGSDVCPDCETKMGWDDYNEMFYCRGCGLWILREEDGEDLRVRRLDDPMAFIGED